MAYIAVTYSFSNATTSDATQVNTNYTDIINGLSDGTKDLNMNAATFAGNLTVNGNTALGNAAGDTINPAGTWNNHIIPNATTTYDLGSTTLGWRYFYFMGNAKYLKLLASGTQSADWTFTFPTTAGTNGYYLKTNGSGVTSWALPTAPTIQTFTSSSGTYTTPSGVSYIKIKAVGGGGGGAGKGSGLVAATAGGNTTFGPITCNGGSLGNANVNVETPGGTASLGTGPIGYAIQGGSAGSTFVANGGAGYSPGTSGGNSQFCQGGRGGMSGGNGVTAITNSGAAGGGGGDATGVSSSGASGGGAGGYVDAIISSPASSYSYGVGAGGAGGTGGTSNGGAGAAGYIEVCEFYQ